MTIFIWITIALLLAKIILMLDGRIPSDIIALGIIGVLLVSGTLSTTDALSCFSNESVILIGTLSIVILGLVYSGAIYWIAEHLYVKSPHIKNLLMRFMAPVVVMSALISSEAVVVLFINVARVVCRRLGVQPSKILLPLSYASALGGMCSLLGSPTNLIIANFYRQSVQHPMDVFAPLLPGLFCACIGIATIMLFRKWIPERISPEEAFSHSTDYTVELLIPSDSDIIGQTVAESGINNIKGGHLVEIVRFDHEVISPVPEDEFLIGGDHLVYAGQINSVLDLRKTHGLVNATHHVFNINEIDRHRHLQVATVHHNSPLIGEKMSDTDFEERNDIVLVAIAREGQRLNSIPRETVLKAGDTLLLEGTKLKAKHFIGNLNFFSSEFLPQGNKRAILSSLILFAMIFMSAIGILPLLHCCIIAAMLMLVTRCCNITQVQEGINWKLIMIFAGSVCLGKAIDETGLANIIGVGVGDLCGDSALFSLIFLATITTIATEFLGNSLCAAIFAPIALHTALDLGANPMTFCISILIATNAAFASPISSNINIMIYGPGGYKFTDFTKIGMLLNIVILIANILIVNLVYPL